MHKTQPVKKSARYLIGAGLAAVVSFSGAGTASQDIIGFNAPAEHGDPSAAFDGMGAIAHELSSVEKSRQTTSLSTGVSAGESCAHTKEAVSLRLADLRELVARTVDRVDKLNRSFSVEALDEREAALKAELKQLFASRLAVAADKARADARIREVESEMQAMRAERSAALNNARHRIDILRQELAAARNVAARRAENEPVSTTAVREQN